MTTSIICPHCGSDSRQVKAGLTNGIQRYKCMACERRYTIERHDRGYPSETRAEAYRLFEQGLKIRQIAKQLSVNHQSVANWIRERKQAPNATMPATQAAPPVELGPHKRRPTISDVARKANVSTATVSSYINHKGRMGQTTRKRIQAAMEELHYTPNALVRAIRQQRTHIFGVLLFGLASLDAHVGDSLTPPLLAGISHAADEAENDMLLYSGWPDHPQRRSGLSFLNGHVDGLLWVAPEMHEPAMERLAAADLPVVAVLSRHVPDEVGYVNADNFGAMQQVIDHLTSLGHERIAYIGPAHSSNFMDRIDGYRNAMRDAGLNADKNMEAIIPQPRRPETIAGALDRLLALPSTHGEGASARLTLTPTAIVAADDGIAAEAFTDLQARGIRVPEDIALTGFNDIFNARHIAGGLTTIRQPFRDMGQIATERLLALIDGAPVDQCRITLPTTLVVRRSTVGG